MHRNVQWIRYENAGVVACTYVVEIEYGVVAAVDRNALIVACHVVFGKDVPSRITQVNPFTPDGGIVMGYVVSINCVVWRITQKSDAYSTARYVVSWNCVIWRTIETEARLVIRYVVFRNNVFERITLASNSFTMWDPTFPFAPNTTFNSVFSKIIFSISFILNYVKV